MRLHTQKEFQGVVQVCAPAFRLKEKDFANDAQNVTPPLAWRNELFDLVAEEDKAHFVVITDGGKREDRGDFRREFTFGLTARTK